MEIKVRIIGQDLLQRLMRHSEVNNESFPKMLGGTEINWKLMASSSDARPEDLLCLPESPCVLVVETHDTDAIENIRSMEDRLHAFISKHPDTPFVMCPVIMAFESPAILMNGDGFPDMISDWMFLPVAISDLALRIFLALRRKGILNVQRSTSANGARVLSEREIQILRLASCGLKNNILAARLFLSETTVKWHLRNIYTKFNVNNRTGAIARARELGLMQA